MTAATLFGWPTHATGSGGTIVEVIGVPSDFGNGITSGARFGPAAIRKASLAVPCGGAGIDRGDIGGDRRGDWQDVLDEVERTVAAVIGRGTRPIVLGGDHGISYAAVAAARTCRPLNIVWFDAHTDFCRLSAEDWHDHKQVLRRIAGLDHVGRIVQVGHRGITYFDEAARYARLSVITAREACRMPATALLDRLPPEEPVYLSIDIDALDPQCAPGTGHPVPGGFDVAQLSERARTIAEQRDVVGIDLMEVNPLLDVDGMTSAAAAVLVAAVVPALCRPIAAASSKAAVPADGGWA